MNVTETHVPTAELASVSRDSVSRAGKITGTCYTFSLGDTVALKEAIIAQNPDWGTNRVSRQVAFLRSEKGALAAARLEADAFVGLQFRSGRTATFGKDRNSGRSSLHFASCEVKASTPRGVKAELAAAKAAAEKAAAKAAEENSTLKLRIAALEALLVK